MSRHLRLLVLCMLTACGSVKSTQFDATPQMVTLTVTRSGNATGSVSSTPAGISCGSTCSTQVMAGTQVTLTATADASATFGGWSGGGCSGTGTCVVTVSADTSVDASFTKQQFTLTVASSGGGTGTVTSTPSGINCGSSCSSKFDVGASVVLHAAPSSGSTFAGWSGGGCSGTSDCTVTLSADVSVTAMFVLNGSLVVTLAGNGTGTVTSNDGNINCGTTCSHQYTPNSIVTLTAVADTSSTFTGWSGGGCSGTGVCTVTVSQTTGVSATFTLKQFTLSVTKSGGGTGTVTSSDSTINCGGTCSATHNYGDVVTLTATPDAGMSFAGWTGGGCSGTGTCAVTVTAATSVNAQFTVNTYTLMLSKTGNGAGTVTPSPAGVSCGAGCSTYAYGTSVTITASASTGSTFGVFTGGGCSTSPCTITIQADTSVSAAFTLNKVNLTLATAGTGTGTVAPSPAGTSCGANCYQYDYGTVVAVTATPTSPSTFTSFSGGGCSTTNPCNVTVIANTTVTATFSVGKVNLTLATNGNGAGTVTPNPVGTSCGANCYQYNQGTVVSVAAAPSTGSNFTTFTGGGCSTTTPCSVTMNGNTTVTATFTLQVLTLTVNKAGGGAGTVVSAPSGINCGGTCTGSFNYGTSITLTPSWTNTNVFNGWSGGGCSAQQKCTITLTTSTTVTATFSGAGPITFDPFWSLAGTTFSNGNLSIAGNSNANNTVEVRTTFGQHTGKWYWEITATGGDGTSDLGGLGIADWNFPNNASYVGANNNSIGFGYGSCCNGSYWVAWPGATVNGTPGATSAIKAGNVYMFALDMDNGRLWIGQDGTWFNNGNPGAGTNPVATGIGGIVAPAIAQYTNTINSFTGNFGASMFSYAVPAGFNPGFYTPAGQCDAFTNPDGTNIPNWTEHLADWSQFGGQVRHALTAGVYSHTLSMNNSTQGDGCAHFQAFYGPAGGQVQAMGVVLRQTSDTSYTVALVQDNTSNGQFNQLYIYNYPAGSDGGGSISGSFGTSPIIRACIVGNQVTLSVDADHDGVYETSTTGTSTVAGTGTAGIMAHTFAADHEPLGDNFCWGF